MNTLLETAKLQFGDKFKQLSDFDDPAIRDGDELGKNNMPGNWVLKAKSDYKPQIVGRDPKINLEDEDEIYGGQYARLSLAAFAYDKAGKKGVSWSLRNVQILGGGERFGGDGGKAADQFDAWDEEETPF